MPTKVEWASETWSPWAGCTKISEGCAHCCALGFARRLQGQRLPKYALTTKDGEWTGKVNFRREELGKPSHWKKPRRIFVQIMGDIAHDQVQPAHFLDVWSEIRNCPWHTFILLTKRPKRLRQLLELANEGDPLPHVWVGATTENQKQFEARYVELSRIVAAVRFISAEPLLGPLNITPLRCAGAEKPYLDWVVTGPETGPGKRPCKEEWLLGLHKQCRAADVPFFLKRTSAGKPVENPNVKQYPKETK